MVETRHDDVVVQVTDAMEITEYHHHPIMMIIYLQMLVHVLPHYSRVDGNHMHMVSVRSYRCQMVIMKANDDQAVYENYRLEFPSNNEGNGSRRASIIPGNVNFDARGPITRSLINSHSNIEPSLLIIYDANDGPSY
jgi:hypothetical protein